MIQTYPAKIKQISRSFEDPQGIETAMRHMMTKTKKKIHAIYVKDLIQNLYDRKMGTPEVFHLTKRLCKHSQQKIREVTTIVMKGKLNDAWKAVRTERYEEKRSWLDLRRRLGSEVDTFNAAWSAEKNRYFASLRKIKKKKIEWIKEKYYRKPDIPDVYKGVQIGDQHLDERFHSNPECYGNTEIDAEETEVLKLHPKYSVFDEIDATDCEAEIEKALAKVRWKKKQDERAATSDSDGNNTENNSRKETFDIEKNEFDFNYARSTELPLNAHTYMPKTRQ